MPITSEKTSINDFLSVSMGSKEASMAIAQNQAELSRFKKIMDEQGFEQSKNIADLFKLQKTYFVLDEDMDKDIYDFVVQYPTGQVEIFDKKLMRSETFFPDYNKEMVLLVIKEDLNKLQAKGFDLLSCTGPAYQS